MYQPLTKEQFQKARDDGFTTEKIIEMESKRKTESEIEKPKKSSFGEFLKGEFGAIKEPETFTRGLIQSTIGSRGVLGMGQLAGRVAATGIYGNQLAEAQSGVLSSKMRLSEATNRLAEEIQKLPEGDSKRDNLISIMQENLKTMGIADETIQSLTQGIQERVITPKQIAGTAINASLTLAGGGLKGTTQTIGIMGKAVSFPTPAILMRTPVLGAEKFFRAAGIRALQTGTIFGGFTTAEGLINDKAVDEIAKSSAISFGVGALGSGIFSLAGTGVMRALTGNKTTARIFRAGLGFGKATQKAEEKSNKLSAEILIKHGAGTADGLKTKYHELAEQAEAEIQNKIKDYLKSTGKGGTFETSQILQDIEKAYRSQFKYSLSRKEVAAFMETLPLDVLRRKPNVNVFELNQLRREITNKILSPTTFTRGNVQEGTTRALMTAGNVLSDRVKGTIKSIIPVFERYSAYLKGFDALLNRVAATQGPVASASRIGGAAVGGAIGGALGGIPGFAAGVGIEELSRSTLGRTAAAVALRKLGIATEKLSQSEITQLLNIFQKAGVSRLLRQ